MFFAVSSMAGDATINSEVTIDIPSQDPVSARQSAISKGEVNGLISLLERLGSPAQAKDIMSTLDAKKISAIVKGVQIVDEKISADRYRARLVVSFDGDGISEIISSVNSPEAKEILPASINAFLIIPGLEMGNQSMLWEEENLFRSAWNNVALEVSSGDVIVPYGDNTDASVLSYESMMTADFQALSSFAVRYGASNIVLLQAKYTSRPDMMLSVVERIVGRQDTSVNVHTYRADPQETRDVLFLRAARDIISGLRGKKEEEMANARAVRGGDRKKIMMLASITTMASWTDLRKKFTSLPMVDKVETLAISARQVDMVVSYRGSEESFTNALAAQSIRLLKNPNYWVIAND